MLSQTDRQALGFLQQNGPDAPGVITDHMILAAHLVYADLVRRGLASMDQGDDGPIYAFTGVGAAALGAPTQH